MILLSFLITWTFFPIFSDCIKGGTPLSQSEIKENIYGVGQFVTKDGINCMCVLLPAYGFYCLYKDGCGVFDNTAADPKVSVMGTTYDAAPHSGDSIVPCAGYSSTYGFFYVDVPPSSIFPATQPPSARYSPPTGTKCQVLGYSTTTNNIPNKIEVFVSDFASCKEKLAKITNPGFAATLKEERHFCAPVLPTPPIDPFTAGDNVGPIFCQKWTTGVKMFWPFSKDEEEDEEKPYIFVGFVSARFSYTYPDLGVGYLLVNEAFQCPNN